VFDAVFVEDMPVINGGELAIYDKLAATITQ
jgi:hypothetical protein